MPNWANKTKLSVAKATTPTRKATLETYDAVVEAARLETFKTGSRGIYLEYQVAGQRFPVRERLTTMASKDGGASHKASSFGLNSYKERLAAFGVPDDLIGKYIQEAQSLSGGDINLSDFIGIPVQVTPTFEEYNGKTYFRIGSVLPSKD